MIDSNPYKDKVIQDLIEEHNNFKCGGAEEGCERHEAIYRTRECPKFSFLFTAEDHMRSLGYDWSFNENISDFFEDMSDLRIHLAEERIKEIFKDEENFVFSDYTHGGWN